MCANREMRRPAFTFISRMRSPEHALRQAAMRSCSRSMLGTGFSQLDVVPDTDHLARLKTVLYRMRDYTLTLDTFDGDFHSEITMGMLVEMRNFVQHSLLSLCPDPSPNGIVEPPLMEMCRIAAIIYSWIVIFPAPLQAMPLHAASARIRELLDDAQADEHWLNIPHLMVWIVFMGAIASFGSLEEQGYIRFLKRALQRLNIDSWSVLRSCLETFLWYSSASDLDGLDLWHDIIEDNSYM